MAWQIRFERAAARELSRLDPQHARHILMFLHKCVAPLTDPRSLGQALKGTKPGEFWKYRVGDYRVIAHIEDSALCILLLRLGNRRDIYR